MIEWELGIGAAEWEDMADTDSCVPALLSVPDGLCTRGDAGGSARSNSALSPLSVSYTHLDVYKRQPSGTACKVTKRFICK